MEPLTLWSRIEGSGHLSSRETTRGIRTNTLKASTDTFKVIESIGDRSGSCYFSPALIASGSRRKQRPPPLPPPRPTGLRGSPIFDRAGSDYCIIDWSPRMLQAWQYKPIDSARVVKGQSSLRGRVRCQSHLVAWERRRREPGSNSVIVTAFLTRCEGHVLGVGALRRVRKIFSGCPAIPSLRGQSPAQIQDRSRKKTWLNTAQAFSRVISSFPRTPPSFPRRREPRENKARRPIPFAERAGGAQGGAGHTSFLRTHSLLDSQETDD